MLCRLHIIPTLIHPVIISSLFLHKIGSQWVELLVDLSMGDDVETSRSTGSNYRAALHWLSENQNKGHKQQTQTNIITHCTVFWKASILSGSGFNKFLASQNFFRENATD